VKEEAIVAREQFLGGRLGTTADIHFSMIPKEDHTKNVLIMFEPSNAVRADKKPKQRKVTSGSQPKRLRR
jgi:hypothetical protein